MADGAQPLETLRSAHAPDPIDVAVGARIRLRRRDIKVSQSTLADALGVSFQQVQKYERGFNRISASMLVRTARALGVQAAWLLGETDDAPPIDGGVTDLLATATGQALLRAAGRLPAVRMPALVRVAQALAEPEA